MGLTTYSRNSEIVISFFYALQMMVKYPQSERIINWHIRLFGNDVDRMKPGDKFFDAAHRMNEELALCQRRRRSRKFMYRMSLIDEVYNHYWINKSDRNLEAAWNLFETGRYRMEG